MALSCMVGGARRTFGGALGGEVAELLDQAFGAEESWGAEEPRRFGDLGRDEWAELQSRARAELGPDAAPNLLAMGDEGRSVFLPAHVQAVAFPLSAGSPLRCASLTGLREELFELADRWGLPMEEDSLVGMLRDQVEGPGGGTLDLVAPEVTAFARLALAANEAMRRDCPLWLIG